MKLTIQLVTALLALIVTGPVTAQEALRFSIISNTEKIGHLNVATQGATTEVDFYVDNNGRGPKHREAITVNDELVPVDWRIEGTSNMGGQVREHFAWTGGAATWQSQADLGRVPADRAPLYVANDGSPWSLAVYAHALMNNEALAILPEGKVRIDPVRTINVEYLGKPLEIYRVTGVTLEPSYLLLDKERSPYAIFGGGVDHGIVVREGYESAVPHIRALAAELGIERAKELQNHLAHGFSRPVYIRNVRIFDPVSGSVSPISTIVVMREEITRIFEGTDLPADAEVVIEGEGGTVIPGLHDMHSHATLNSGLLYLAAGVTTTRDLGNDNGSLQRLLTQIAAGEVAWPQIVPAGFIEGRSPYSARYGHIPETLEEALNSVRWYADRGYAEIKLYNSFNPDWVEPVAIEAHRLGLRVSGHVPAFSSPDRVAEEGYDAIAHINQLMLGWILDPGEDTRTPLRLTAMARGGDLDLSSPEVDKTVSSMVQNDVALDTTASILEQLMLSRAREVPPGQEQFLAHMPIGFQRYRKRSYVTLEDEADDARYHAGFAKVLETIGMLHKRGVRLLPGTDDATGFSVLRELELYVAAGLTPAEALRSGTLGAEEFLERDSRIGKIETGYVADLVLLDGNPITDFSAIRRPRMVMRGGTSYFPDEIYEAIGIKPFVPSVNILDTGARSTGNAAEQQSAGHSQ